MSDALDTIAGIGSILNLWLGIGIFLALAWPFVLLAAAAMLSPQAAIMVIPIIGLLPVVPVFFCLVGGGVAIIRVGLDESGRKALAWLATAIGFELVTGVYLATVPVSNDVRLIPLLVLVVFAACFLKFGGMAGTVVRLLVLTGIGITLVFLLGGRARVVQEATTVAEREVQPSSSSGQSDRQNPAASHNYDKSICDNPIDQDHGPDTAQSFDIPLRDGCFSGWVTIPGEWRNYSLQLLSKPDDAWVALWGNSWNASPIGPYSRQQFNNDEPWGTASTFTNRFRLQGKGTLRLYRTWPPPEPTEQPSVATATDPQLSSHPPAQPGGSAPEFMKRQGSFLISLKGCQRIPAGIVCLGSATNTSQVPLTFRFNTDVAPMTYMVDNLGNKFNDQTAGFINSTYNAARPDADEQLLPNTPRNFALSFVNVSEASSSLTLALRCFASAAGADANWTFLTFGNIPIRAASQSASPTPIATSMAGRTPVVAVPPNNAGKKFKDNQSWRQFSKQPPTSTSKPQ